VEVVKQLLEREEVNPDVTDSDGRTPLSYATKGRSGIVERMASGEWGANPGKSDRDGVMRILLGRPEVNPNMQNNDGRTPLSYAAEGGYQGMVRLLLEREEVSPNVADNDGRTPLSFAIRYGHNRVAALLLSHKAVTPTV